MHPPIELRRVLLCSPLTRALGMGFCLFCLHAAALAGPIEQHSLELGGGVHVPFDDQVHAVYTVGSDLTVAYNTRVSADGRTRVRFEGGWIRASGAEITPVPTFEVLDARYDLLQIGLGLRQNVVTAPDIGTAFWMGAGVLNVFSWWRDPLGQTTFADVMGFYLELAPEFPVSDHWRLWVRTRLQVVADADYGDYAPLDYNSSLFDAGVSYAWF